VLLMGPSDDGEDSGGSDGLPSVAEVWRVVYAMAFFLHWQPDHVVVLHDATGRYGKSRACFVVACYLAWAHGDEFTAPDAVTYYVERRRAGEHAVHGGGGGGGRRGGGGRDAMWASPSGGGSGGYLTGLPSSWWEMLKAFQSCVQRPRPFPARRVLLHRLLLTLSGDEVEASTMAPVVRVTDGTTVWDSQLDVDPDHPDAFVWDEGSLKCQVDRLLAGDIVITVWSHVVRHRQITIFPTPSGDLPDVR
jgi:hypothetical protein